MTQAIAPEFIRLPEPKTPKNPQAGFCPITGLSRTGLYNLTVPCKANGFRPAVPAKCLKQKGNLRGIWLIPYEPLISYLRALPTGEDVRAENSDACDTASGVEAGQPAGASRSRRSGSARPTPRPSLER